MTQSTHHTRRSHQRQNPDGTISDVSEAQVTNRETTSQGMSLGGEAREAHHDALLDMGTPETPEEKKVLTPEEKAQKAELLNRLMSSASHVVNEQGEPVEGQEATLLTIASILEALNIRMGSSEESDDILFALENPEWSSIGLNREQHLPWVALKLNPEETQEWLEAGFTPFTAQKWVTTSNYGWSAKRVEPKDAKVYDEAEVEPNDARRWGNYGFTGEEAVQWIKTDLPDPLREASAWETAGVKSPKEREEWIAVGAPHPSDVRILKMLGSEAAQRWVDAGLDENLNRAVAWRVFVNDNYTEKDLLEIMNNEPPISVETFGEWHNQNIPASDIPEFMKKGYTPKRAATQLKKGIDGSKAKDLRGKEIIPGKAWKQIHSAFKNSAASRNTQIAVTHHTRGDYMNTVTVEKTNSEYYHQNVTYSLKFTNTGRFLGGGRLGYRDTSRTLNDLLSEISV